MASFGTQFNPSAVMMGNTARSAGPYLWNKKTATPPANPMQISGQPASATVPTPPSPLAPPSASQQQGNVVGPTSVRSTGTGPFDSAYRQNLATYAGGQYAAPGGNLSFNPTDLNTFPGMASGGGNAPVTGMPTTLIDQALGGQGFSWTPPITPANNTANPSTAPNQTLQQWMNQFLQNGNNMQIGMSQRNGMSQA